MDFLLHGNSAIFARMRQEAVKINERRRGYGLLAFKTYLLELRVVDVNLLSEIRQTCGPQSQVSMAGVESGEVQCPRCSH